MSNLPDTMKYIAVSGPGAADVMRVASGPLPAIGETDVLIKVEYAGVNRPDVIQRSGSYAPPPGASPVMGLEVSGTIVAVGGKVTSWKAGDAVCALTPGGGYAEYCAAPAAHCLSIPAGLSMLEAAGVPENFFTVWVNVFDTCKLSAGEKFLVHGGSSGIGLTAIQLAKAIGAEVFTTVGNEEKAAFCKSVGADHALNYKTQDWMAEVAATTQKKGVNVILDMVGGSYIEKNLRVLALEGRYCFIAFLEGGSATVDFRPLMMKRQTITGSTLRARPDAQKAMIAAALKEKVWPLLEAKKVKPVIHKTFALDEIIEAHKLMESSTHIGKIMLKVA
ncbi:MAG: NAD(P)H-quinone oxidoreductase [Betaproteobacteria bacterium]|nr:NAD(P)H-quinone oxidoreductase [Betaproteobacteria bacterium]